ANHFRRNNDYDKAAGIYEQILNEDNTDAEAYWSLVLCRYGIEYVEDPTSHKRIPTVNRAQFTSIYMDEDYKSALKYADGYQKVIYEQEAKAIDEIQKGILEISSKEEPFDVFICYKETDNSGRRTPDSVLANDLYHQLTQEGFKVFFARITLEDKLGTAYEPYIFAALNSSKVMVALGTKPEYFNAVWVKNEWSRYLALIKNGEKKMLIPAYKDMDPYDLPEEFSHLQAQDMGKLGFMQDLIRGIRKILNADEEKPTVVRETVVASGNANVQPLLKRAFMFLEDGDFKSADEYCEKVLDIDPENGQAYLGKLMAELKVKVQEKLKDCAEPFDDSNNYKKAIRYGDEELAETLKGYVELIKNRNEENRLKKAYDEACKAMNNAKTEEQFKDAAEKFGEIKGYRDSDSLCESCYAKAEESRKSGIYDLAKKDMESDTVSLLEKAVELFESIADYEDAGTKVGECKVRIEELEAKAEKAREEARIEAERKKKKAIKITKIASPIVAVLITFIIMLNTVILPKIKYNNLIKKYGKETVDEINSLQIGDIYIFGTYEQDNDVSNGKEEIEWQVLAKEDYRVLLISKYALDCVQYNSEWEDVTWETCTLRKWLNETFINSAFNSDEQALIPETNVSADKNPEYSTNPGNATKDKIFLLSISEVNKYFLSDDERMCAATDYAKAQGAYISDDNTVGGKGACWWWLRSPGHSQHHAADVYSAGSVYRYGDLVNYGRGSVRPALWITLES
ncbi:MAG: DUF6273 domain-containing protein, partial [Oscillospiraceae bacterium]|nr:DUF6273 domain-containing protein [Oscillospiraceae bacterium]